MRPDEHPKFSLVTALRAAIEDSSFAKLALGKFRGEGEERKAIATLVVIKGKPQLKLVTSFARKDETKTLAIEHGIEFIAKLIGKEYMSVTLFTSERDIRLDYSRKGVPHLAVGKATLKTSTPLAHNRQKAYRVPPDRPYLKALGVADGEGLVKPTMQGKYRQICRFIEIAADMLSESGVEASAPFRVVDFGAGKGYLTFAFYDYATTTLGLQCQMTGIEVRKDLVDFCNTLATELGFGGLTFVAQEAAHVSPQAADVVIALHACDTATDDAMAFGIRANARLILSAPCCQHEIAQQIKDTGDGLKGLIKYPLLKQRQADLITDAARALLLEASGYKVRLIEFTTTEHTSKNILIAAVKTANVNRASARDQFRALKAATGFLMHHLESQLKDAE